MATVVALGAALAGCGGPQLGRIGPAVALPNGESRSACERAHWYEIAPTRVQATAVTPGFGVNTYYSQFNEGIGVYRAGKEDPEDLEDAWPAMQERTLQAAHEARVEPVYAAARTSTWWVVGGLVGLGAGLGTAAAIQGESKTGAAIAGVSGLAVGLVGVIAALATAPSAEAELRARAREKLFVKGEDDFVAVARGIDRANARQRGQCGGNPVPFERPRQPVSPAAPVAPQEPAAPMPTPAPVPSEAAPEPPQPAPTEPRPEEYPPLSGVGAKAE